MVLVGCNAVPFAVTKGVRCSGTLVLAPVFLRDILDIRQTGLLRNPLDLYPGLSAPVVEIAKHFDGALDVFVTPTTPEHVFENDNRHSVSGIQRNELPDHHRIIGLAPELEFTGSIVKHRDTGKVRTRVNSDNPHLPSQRGEDRPRSPS
jgi:hypothetical protein